MLDLVHELNNIAEPVTKTVSHLAPAGMAWSRSFSANTVFTTALTIDLLVSVGRGLRLRLCPKLRPIRGVIGSLGFEGAIDGHGGWQSSTG